MPTLEEALSYMGIDYADEFVMRNVKRALDTARKILHGAVGEDIEDYFPNDPRVSELILIYAEDLYSERGVMAKVGNSTRKLVASVELQLKLELLRAKEEAAANV